MWIDGNGYFINTKEDFGEKYKGEKLSSLPGENLNEFKPFYRKGDLVHLQIDMIHRKIRIWNESHKEKEKLFEIDSPKSVAAMVDFCPNQKVTVVSQTFTYKGQL